MTTTHPTTPTTDPTWVPIDPETAESRAVAMFGGSLTARAKKRKVSQGANQAFNSFTVLGDPNLGDSYPAYIVHFDGRYYHCECRTHFHGASRNICSHSLAVMLYRKGALKSAPAKDPGTTSAPAPRERSRKVVEEEGAGEEPPSSPTDNENSIPSIPVPAEIPGSPPLPSWVLSIRTHQWDAIEQITDRFDEGEPVVFVDAPTGSGKTLIGELTRRMEAAKALYICSTKTLQDQFLIDFPYAKVLKGRSNYPTLDFPEQHGSGFQSLSAADCTLARVPLPACASCPDSDTSFGSSLEDESPHCVNCHPVSHCPYRVAKTTAAEAELAILNTSYFLTECQTPKSLFSNAFDLIIVDEADLLENELMSLIEVDISPRMQKDLHISPPGKKTVASSWGEWVRDHAIPKVKAAIPPASKAATDPRTAKRRNTLSQLLSRLSTMEKGIESGNWVYTGYESKDGSPTSITFKPIRVDEYGPKKLWRHGQKWLLMSATLIDAQDMSDSLGLPTWIESRQSPIPISTPIPNQEMESDPGV